MKIRKRTGTAVDFQPEKVKKAMEAAFASVQETPDEAHLQHILESIGQETENREKLGNLLTVEEIQDRVELGLMSFGCYKAVRSFILYRSEHAQQRAVLQRFSELLPDDAYLSAIKETMKSYQQEFYPTEQLLHKFISFTKPGMPVDEAAKALIKAALELTSKEAPKWEFIASRFLSLQLSKDINRRMNRLDIHSFDAKIHWLTEENLYGSYILEHYTEADLLELEAYMDVRRDTLLTYSSLDLLIKRYLIRSGSNKVLETPQEMFMGISMHLAIPEQVSRVLWAKRIYDILSTLKVTVATPTMSNARKPYHQLSSCFIDTVPDSLDGIYRSIDNFAKVSKFGGGMGLYFGKVRAVGSDIRGFKGAAGGVMRWIKLANDTAVAVDQLGVRQGSVAVYLDVWHKDLPEFLQMKTNNGDDRMKAHDVFPAVCYPDLFWELARDDMDASWYLMCPHEIQKQMGWSLEDFFGAEWTERYMACVANPAISKREMKIKDLVRLIIKSVVETGTPFAFNRDHVNRMNPNGHHGMIYASNLCTEIAQNMSPIETISQEVETVDGDTIVVTRAKAGDFVVCNLASLVLGNIDTDGSDLDETVETIVRALDNVIDLNYYPVPYARITNQQYRSIGLGTSGYHHLLAKKAIHWESEEHLAFADKLYERINRLAISASSRIAVEKGSYAYFKGSDWQTGAYFDKRQYTGEEWDAVRKQVEAQGLRNAYIMAVAPTGTTSVIAGTTASIDPIMNRYFLEEKKGLIVPRVAPELSLETWWFYKSAHTVDQGYVVDAAGIRQRHIDQAQSVNLFITPEFSMRQVLSLYIRAWERGVKTLYYVRSKSLEVEDCDVCSA